MDDGGRGGDPVVNLGSNTAPDAIFNPTNLPFLSSSLRKKGLWCPWGGCSSNLSGDGDLCEQEPMITVKMCLSMSHCREHVDRRPAAVL